MKNKMNEIIISTIKILNRMRNNNLPTYTWTIDESLKNNDNVLTDEFDIDNERHVNLVRSIVEFEGYVLDIVYEEPETIYDSRLKVGFKIS